MDEKEHQIYPRIRSLCASLKGKANVRIMKLTNGKVTLLQSAILKYLSECEKEDRNIFQKDIETYFSINKSTLSEILSCLEKNGFIFRKHSKDDARLREIKLTEEGIKINETIGKEIDNFENGIQKKLTKEELDEFFMLVKKLEK